MAAFTVGLPERMEEWGLDPVLTCFRQAGGDQASALRVVDPMGGGRWVPAWRTEAEAEAVVRAVRELTEEDGYRVIAVPDAEPTIGPLGPVDMRVFRRSDGWVYGIDHQSRFLIRKAYPETAMMQFVHLIAPPPDDPEPSQSRYWDQIATMLTGLNEEQIRALGGLRVFNPETRCVYRESPLVPVTSSPAPPPAAAMA
ncbi:MAG: hypothetical protein K2W96_08975 [Gemmataceae bacterium]|nr:hypothetical protein [Gemmataceae bacterium]